MWVKFLQTDIVVLVCTIAFILWAEDNWKRKVPLGVKQFGGAVLVLAFLFLPICFIGIIWS